MTEQLTYQRISELTGFDQGEAFCSESEIRAYFTVEEQIRLFGDDAVTDQDLLDAMAERVIEWTLSDPKCTLCNCPITHCKCYEGVDNDHS